MQRGVWAGEKLKALLAEKGMTQEQLGNAAGLRRTDVNRYVRNKQRLGETNGRRIALALEVPLEELGLTADGDGEASTLEAIARLERRVEALQATLEQMAQQQAQGDP